MLKCSEYSTLTRVTDHYDETSEYRAARLKVPMLSTKISVSASKSTWASSVQFRICCKTDVKPILLRAVHILGDDHTKCCTQIYYSLALITKGSVRTLVRSVEESNGAEARRLIHSRYAPETQRLDAKDHVSSYLKDNLHLGIYANSAALRSALLQWCNSILQSWSLWTNLADCERPRQDGSGLSQGGQEQGTRTTSTVERASPQQYG